MFHSIRVTGASNGTLYLDSNIVSVGQTIAAADIDNFDLQGNPSLSFKPHEHYNGLDARLLFKVIDIDENGSESESVIDNTLSFTVTPVNDSPAGTDKTFTITEDETYFLASNDFGFRDPVENNSFIALQITEISNGSLYLAGAEVSAGQSITVADIDKPDTSGNTSLSFRPDAHYHGNEAHLLFRVVDIDDAGNKAIADFESTLSFSVTPVNDPPTAADNYFTIAEDQTYFLSLGDFGFDDPVENDRFFAVKITGTNNGVVFLAGNEVSDGQFINVTDINTLDSRGHPSLSFKPDTHYNGSGAKLLFKVIDIDATGNQAIAQSDKTLSFNVTPVNDPPTGTDKSINITEDETYYLISDDFGFLDSIENHGFSALQINTVNNGILALDGIPVSAGQTIAVADVDAPDSNGNTLLSFRPYAHYHGTGAKLLFKVIDIDDAGNRATAAFENTLSFNIAPVNDPPTGTDNAFTMAEDEIYFLSGSDFGFHDPVENHLFSAIQITGTSNGVALLGGSELSVGQTIDVADIDTLDSNGYPSLAFKPEPEYNGAGARLVFRVIDTDSAGNEAIAVFDNTLSFNVTAVNDRPTGTNMSITIAEDESYYISSVDFGFQDRIDNHEFSAVEFSGTSNGTLTLNGNIVNFGQTISVADINTQDAAGNNALSFTPDPHYNGSAASVFFRVIDIDESGITLSAIIDNDLLFTVTPVNDPPSGTSRSLSILQNEIQYLTSANFGFSDPLDNHPFVAVEIADISNGILLLDGSMVAAGQTVRVADIDKLDSLGNSSLSFNVDGNDPDLPAAISFKVIDEDEQGRELIAQSENLLSFSVFPVISSPIGANNTISVTSGDSHTLTLPDFGLPQILNPQSQIAVEISSVSNGVLTLNGQSISGQQIIHSNDIVTIDSAATPALSYTPYMHENINTYVTFRLLEIDTNGSPLTASEQYTLTFEVIQPVNSPPLGTDRIFTINEDQAHYFKASDFGFSDPLDNHSFYAVQLASSDNGVLMLNGTAISSGQTVLVSDVNRVDSQGNPSLSFIPHVNFSGTESVLFKVIEIDNNEQLLEARHENTLTFHVMPVNDPPVSANNSISIPEGKTYQFNASDFAFNDPADNNILLSLVVENVPDAAIGTLFNDGIPVRAGDTIAAAAINSGQLQFQAISYIGDVSTAKFDFQLRDDGGLVNNGLDTSPTSSITLTVTNINDPPTGTSSHIRLEENSTWYPNVSDFGFNDPIDGDSLMGILIDSIPENGVLSKLGIPVAAGINLSPTEITQLQYTPDTNEHGDGYSQLTFRVQDAGGNLNGGRDTDLQQRTLTFDITALSDSPAAPSNHTEQAAPPAVAAAALEQEIAEAINLPPPPQSDRIRDSADLTVARSNNISSFATSKSFNSQALLSASLTSAAADLYSMEPPPIFVSNFEDLIIKAHGKAIASDIDDQPVDFIQTLNNQQLPELQYPEGYDSLKGRDLLNGLDESRHQLSDNLDLKFIRSVAGTTAGFSIGYAMWLFRGGLLLSSVLSSLPAWRSFDPLPVLDGPDSSIDDNDQSLEEMVNNDDDDGPKDHQLEKKETR